jgi:hypothetical protein
MNGRAILPDAVLTMNAAHCASCHGDGNAYHLYSWVRQKQTNAEVYPCLKTRVRLCSKLFPCDFEYMVDLHV